MIRYRWSSDCKVFSHSASGRLFKYIHMVNWSLSLFDVIGTLNFLNLFARHVIHGFVWEVDGHHCGLTFLSRLCTFYLFQYMGIVCKYDCVQVIFSN
ncbi:hypothetical protein V1505DRAFT_220767 [Lipomyces doorenjongii]